MLVERMIDSGDVVLNIAEGRTDGTPLLLLHGATQNWQCFSEFLPSLEQHWHIYAPDLRGHSKSGWVPSAYHVNDHAQDVIHIIEHVIGQPVILMGFSLGGSITLAVAARLRSLVRAIVVLDPGLIFRNPHLWSIPGPHQWVYDYGAWLSENVFTARSVEELAERYKANNPGVDDLGALAMATDLRRLDPTLLGAWKTYHDGLDFEHILSHISCPTLMVRGDPALGGVVGDPDAALLQRLIPQSTILQITGVGHGLLWDQAGTQTLAHVRRFLEAL
jgi:pimeloyl-ACP methyl ester carboxylesterase